MTLTPQQQQFRARRNTAIYEMYQKGDKSSEDVGEFFGLTGAAVRIIVKNLREEMGENELS